jgi:UDP-N-acetylmuramate dehydrogenase
MDKIRELMKKINIRRNEPMSLHTSFKTGGPAQMYAEPPGPEALAELLAAARADGCPVFILGGGANLLVADKGIRGIVINTCRIRGAEILGPEEAGQRPGAALPGGGHYLYAGAGLPAGEAALLAEKASLGGLEFIHAMPGSVGGAVWMNARCYGVSTADILESVSFLDKDQFFPRKKTRADKDFIAAFGYKKSPFQPGGSLEGAVITGAAFRLSPGDREKIKNAMRRIEEDRRAKGHFAAPSAGSVFKNNRAFGEPTGKILDRLGLRGLARGGARVSPLHANIIINNGGASSADIRGLIETLQTRAGDELGIRLEPEIIFAGDWE